MQAETAESEVELRIAVDSQPLPGSGSLAVRTVRSDDQPRSTGRSLHLCAVPSSLQTHCHQLALSNLKPDRCCSPPNPICPTSYRTLCACYVMSLSTPRVLLLLVVLLGLSLLPVPACSQSVSLSSLSSSASPDTGHIGPKVCTINPASCPDRQLCNNGCSCCYRSVRGMSKPLVLVVLPALSVVGFVVLLVWLCGHHCRKSEHATGRRVVEKARGRPAEPLLSA